MHKRQYITIALSLVILSIVLTVAYLHLKRQEHLAARNHLLCEVLKPGMSVDEVLETLKQAGEFTMSRGEPSTGLLILGVNFTDPQGRELYGGFTINFFDRKYRQAYIRNFDYFEDICLFPWSGPSATATSKPP